MRTKISIAKKYNIEIKCNKGKGELKLIQKREVKFKRIKNNLLSL